MEMPVPVNVRRRWRKWNGLWNWGGSGLNAFKSL